MRVYRVGRRRCKTSCIIWESSVCVRLWAGSIDGIVDRPQLSRREGNICVIDDGSILIFISVSR